MVTADKGLKSLQVVRAVAATAVVYAHAARAATVHRPAALQLAPGTWLPAESLTASGALGVDLFFVLSGFLMVYISPAYFAGERTAHDFLAKRWARIWPLYALFTIWTLLWELHKANAAVARALDFQLHRLLGAFLFFPTLNKDGNVAPILGVGWTLNYEALFYLSFAAVIWLRPRRPLLALSALLVTLYGAGLLIPTTAAGRFLHNDLIFEFLIGASIASVIRRGWQPRHGLSFLAVGCLLIASTMLISAAVSLPRLLIGGVPVSFLLLGALALERKVTFPRWSIALGNASYSLYLTHIFIAGAVCDRIIARLVTSPLAVGAIIGAISIAILACITVGCLVHWMVERPLLLVSARLANRLTQRPYHHRSRLMDNRTPS